MILVADARVNSGETAAVSQSIAKAATRCSLTLMATVQRVGPQKQYRLAELGVGYSIMTKPIDQQPRRVVISSDTLSESGVSLGLIAGQALRRNEQALGDVRVLAKTDSACLFDAPSIMSTDRGHQKLVTRHLVFISPETGQGEMLVWLLLPPGRAPRLMETAPRAVPFGTVETRNVHVDGNAFNLFGIPSELAFALEDLPPGTNLRWTDALRRIAALDAYDAKQFAQLRRSVAEMR